MGFLPIIIQLISGAVGGNAAGAALKDKGLGTLGNSIASILGGGIGGQILQAVLGASAAGGGGLDLQSILANVAGGGVGGGLVMVVIAIIKRMMAKK